jgi:nuclear pore complex protein Nup50
MSSKRRADKELTSDNWDQEDEPEEKGTFRIASADVLKNRVIKTAKRRMTNGTPNSERSSIFSGFTGFGTKMDDKKSSFSFVSNLGGVDTANTCVDAGKKSVFSLSTELTPKVNEVTKPSFSLSSSSSNIPTIKSVESNQPSVSMKNDASMRKNDASSNSSDASKLCTLSDKLKTVANERQPIPKQNATTVENGAETPDEIFLKKLRSLNLLCTEWIIKHLNENLSYILTPIFDDYKKYLTQLREERRLASSTNKKPRIELPETQSSNNSETSQIKVSNKNMKDTAPKINFGTGSSLSSKEKSVPETSKSMPSENETAGFKFFSREKMDDGAKSSGPMDFNFGKSVMKFNADTTNEVQSSNSNADPTPPPLFSFGSNSTPLTSSFFSQNSVSKPEMTSTETDDDGPPPVEDITVKEEGSVYDRKCKIFIKKDSNFIDHGIGFLFIKLVGDEQKCQVIVRANNKLANIIINVLLTSNIPVKKMGKNNVMMVCCPTPEAKQPTSILIKVKTPEDAEDLFNNLNKYRK